MITHRTKVRRHLRSARVAALTPEDRRDELRAAEARYTERHGRSGQAGADPAGSTGAEAGGSEAGSDVV